MANSFYTAYETVFATLKKVLNYVDSYLLSY